MSRLPDNILVDLGRKCGDDVSSRIRLTTDLCTDPRDRLLVALYAAATTLGAVAGHSANVPSEVTATPDDHVDMIWKIMRPMALMVMGGSEASFEELLRKAPR